MNRPEAMRILYDTKLRRPACVLLQTMANGDWFAVQRLWPSGLWLTHPTGDMRAINGTEEQWKRVAERDCEAAR